MSSAVSAELLGPGTRPPSIEALTGLRFVAAAVVMIEHFPQLVPGLSSGAAEQGGAGVGLFFVLSGFVLTYNYADRMLAGTVDDRRFVHARLVRIVPLHVLALVLLTVVFVVIGNPVVTSPSLRTVGAWLANLLLVHAWVPALLLHSWNGPSWSISAELAFYLAFPLFVRRVLRGLGRTAVAVLLAACIAVSIVGFLAVSLVVARREVGNGNATGAPFLLSRLAYLPWLRIWEFFAGCALARLYATRRDGGLLGTAGRRHVALAVVAVLVVAIQVGPDCLATSCGPAAGSARALVVPTLYPVYVPLAVLVIAALAWGPTVVGGVLSRPTVLLLGEASYAFYLLQWSTRAVLDDAGVFGGAATWVAVVLTWMVSVAVHRRVEAPLRRRLMRPAEPRPASSPRPRTPRPS